MSRLHREHPDATPEEIETLELAELMCAGPARVEVVGRYCRNCGQRFEASKAMVEQRPGSKWSSLCTDCLRWEL